MEYNTIIFDIDGVLIDTHKLQYDSTRTALLDICNIDINLNNDISKLFNSTITTRNKLQYLFKEKLITYDDIDKVYDYKKKIANEYFKTITNNFEKIELFKFLKENKYKIGIVTNGNKESAIIILTNLGIFEFVDTLITNEDVDNPKPSPDPYNLALNKLHSNPKSTIIFEDSEIGIKSAEASGCYVYIVKYITDINLNSIKNILNIR